MTAQKVDPSTVSKYEGFIHAGKTTKQEIQDRLGSAQSVYENGRILIYHVYLQDDGRMNLSLGLWDVIEAIEGKFKKIREESRIYEQIAVAYDANSIIVGVFDHFGDFDVLPDDGHSAK